MSAQPVQLFTGDRDRTDKVLDGWAVEHRLRIAAEQTLALALELVDAVTEERDHLAAQLATLRKGRQ